MPEIELFETNMSTNMSTNIYVYITPTNLLYQVTTAEILSHPLIFIIVLYIIINHRF
jgi:hypothetical protein